MSAEPSAALSGASPPVRRSTSVGTPALRPIRRVELRRIVPLADTTIYELEQRGEFPQRFNLTPRCVVWDLDEVEAWLSDRRRASRSAEIVRAPAPDVRQRKTRPVGR
jgi:prophage regulatory protein